MNMIFTESGSKFEVEDGRITRISSHPITDVRTGRPVDEEIDRWPFKWITPPVIGQSAKCVLLGHPVLTQVMTTSPVVGIVQVAL